MSSRAQNAMYFLPADAHLRRTSEAFELPLARRLGGPVGAEDTPAPVTCGPLSLPPSPERPLDTAGRRPMV